MIKKDFDALTVGQRVIVTGTQDGKSFYNETGVIIDPEDVSYTRKVRFDTWQEGHGVGQREWNFFDVDASDFDIAPEKTKAKKTKRPHGKQEYRGNGKHEWETVAEDASAFDTWRLRVPGGWLYRRGSAMTFVPVPEVVGYAV